jgi:hypothetical protein
MQSTFRVEETRIDFDDVAVGASPSYRLVHLTNLDPVATIYNLKLQTSHPCVSFQLRNENFFDNEVVSENALFDTVGVVGQCTIPAGETIVLVAVLTPSESHFGNPHASQFSVVQGSLTFTVLSTPTASGGGSSADGSPTSVQIPFSARTFLSSMTVFPTELACRVTSGKTELYEIEVANRSVGTLLFVMRPQAMPHPMIVVDVVDMDTPSISLLGQRISVEPHSSKRCAVALKSTSERPLQHNAVIQCDNLNDARNTFLMNIAVNVATDSAQSELVAVSDASLDFGDLYQSGHVGRSVTVTNISTEDVVVRLLAAKLHPTDGELTLLSEDQTPLDELTILQGRAVKVLVRLKALLNKERHTQYTLKFDAALVVASKSREQRVTLRSIAMVHVSKIFVSQQKVNFGDCQVGQTKRTTITIENKSPLPGSVIVQLRSKIVSVEGIAPRQERELREVLTLPAQGSHTLELRITPQRVNPTYKKQLIIVNAANSDERFIVNIEANNMAPQEAKMHDELYSWECALGYEATLAALSGAPLLVPYAVRNRTTAPLTLRLTTTSTEIDALMVDDDVKERLESVAAELGSVYLGTEESQSTSCERVAAAREELNTLLAQRTKPTTALTLGPEESVFVFVRILRTTAGPDVQSKEDGVSVHVDGVDLPRFVRLSYTLCSSKFDIGGQRTKNFGDVNIGERKTTKLSVTNKCKSFLFFTVSKSRSVTAGHLRVENAPNDKQVYYGTVRPFATKEIEVSFHPGIKGMFDEKIRVCNVLDPSNEVVVTVKATVTKVDTFDVAPESWSFGELLVQDEQVRVGAKFVVSNTSRSRREFRMKLNDALNAQHEKFLKFDGVDVKMTLEIEHLGAGSGSTRKIEEQIEKLEQKLKIYVRKQKVEKIEPARRRIDALKRALQGEEVEIIDDHYDVMSSSEDEAPRAKNRLTHSELFPMVLREGIAFPVLSPGESASITIGLICVRTVKEGSLAQTSTMALMVFEAKDQEVNKVVPIDLTIAPLVVPSATSTSALTVSHSGRQTASSGASHPDLPVLTVNGMDPSITGEFLGAPSISLHNTMIGEPTMFRISVSASREAAFVVLEPHRCGTEGHLVDPKLKFTPRNGIAKPDELTILQVECYPRSVGPQRFIVPIKNLKNPSDVKYFTIDMNPILEEETLEIEPKFIDFEKVIVPLNVGKSSIKSVLVRSRSTAPLNLLVRSNKPAQVVLYRDAAAVDPFVNPFRLPPKGSCRVYCRYLPGEGTDQYLRPRSVVSGIIVEAFEFTNDSYAYVSRIVARVEATIGSGLLKLLSSPVVDLGIMGPHDRHVTTTCTLRNPSELFPIEYRMSLSSNVVSVDKTDIQSVIGPQQERKILVTLKSNTPGLMQEWISIQNLSCNQPALRCQISVLKQDGLLSIDREQFVFPVVPVMRCAENAKGFRLASQVHRTMIITNHSAKDFILIAKTSAPLFIADADDKEDKRSGGRFRVDAKHAHRLICHLFDVPHFTLEETEKLSAHQPVSHTITIPFEVGQVLDDARYAIFRMSRNVPAVGQCMLMPKFTTTFAISEGSVQPLEIDVGKLGINRQDQETTRLQFNLKNHSLVLPLEVVIESEPTLQFTVKRITVPPGQSCPVEASLNVKLIRTQGSFRFQVFFVNQTNTENEIAAVVTGRYFWKLFQLWEEGGKAEDDVRESLTMPPCKLDVHSEAGGLADIKLSVTSSEKDTSLTLKSLLNPKVAEVLTLQVLKYDATAVVESLLFSGSKAAQIRLRCCIQSNQLPALLNAFFGQRRRVTPTTPEEAAEIEKWRSMSSPPTWIGTLSLSNAVTADEDVQIFMSLHALTTIQLPQTKTVLRCHTRDEGRLVYKGTIFVTNCCVAHTVSLLAAPCVSAKVASSIQLSCVVSQPAVGPKQESTVEVTAMVELGSESQLESAVCVALLDQSVTLSGLVERFTVVHMDPIEAPPAVLHHPPAEMNAASSAAAAGAAAATAVTQPSKSALRSPNATKPAFELVNCIPVPGAEGSYTYSVAALKDSDIASDVRLVYNAPPETPPVDVTVTVMTQSPTDWLRIPSLAPTIRPQESLPLKLAVTAPEVGTYTAHVCIMTSGSHGNDSAALLVLRIQCEIMATTAEALFDVFSTQGSKLQGANYHIIPLGTLIEGNTLRCHGFDLVNKTTSLLELPVSIKLIKVHVKRLRDDVVIQSGDSTLLPVTVLVAQETDSPAALSIVAQPKGRHHIGFVAFVSSPSSVVQLPQSLQPQDVYWSVEADVSMRCKLARDAAPVGFRVRFDVRSATFEVDSSRIVLPLRAEGAPQLLSIVCRNRCSSAPVSLVVCLESPLLSLAPSGGTPSRRIQIGPGGTGGWALQFDGARAGAAALERGVEEHVFVYSEEDPSERYMVSVAMGKQVSTTHPQPFVASGGLELESRVHVLVRKLLVALGNVNVDLFARTVNTPVSTTGRQASESSVAAEESSSSYGPTPTDTKEDSSRAQEQVLQELLLEYAWLTDECALYAKMLRSTRQFTPQLTFLQAAVLQHRTVKAWKSAQQKGQMSRCSWGALGKMIEIAESAPTGKFF